MRKKFRITAIICCGLLLLILVGALALHSASQKVPKFYRRAMAVDPTAQQQANHQMVQKITALVSDQQKEGRWQALFTAEQINGWLAVDLVENHPQALPEMARDPRVAISPDRVTLACRFRRGDFTSVLSLTIEPYVPKPNVLALRIDKARAGLLPVPLGEILDRISKAADSVNRDGANVRLHWRQIDGDPVVFISIPPPRNQDGKLVRIETIRLGQGEILLAGSTESLTPPVNAEPLNAEP